MKKLLAMLLCLALCFSCALAETTEGTVEIVTIDFGDFTMDLKATDLLQQGEKTDGGTMAIIHPDYKEEDSFHDNIAIAWMEMNIGPVISTLGAEAYAQAVLDSAKKSMADQGINVTDAALLNALLEDDELLIMYSMTVDYSGMGIDLAITLYAIQAYAMDAELGTYLFNITTDTIEDLLALTSYIDSVTFANEAPVAP